MIPLDERHPHGPFPRDRTPWSERWLDSWYRHQPGWIDGTVEFHGLCIANLVPGHHILEVGSGPGNPTSAFLATIGPTHGLDCDPAGNANPSLQSFHELSGSRYPFPDGTFDAAVSNYVVEHIADPVEHLREVLRVLRPGSPYVFRTPNLWHYVALVSALTPHWFHTLAVRRLSRSPSGSHDPYPTFYRMNSPGAVRRLSQSAGFEVTSIAMVEKEPLYTVACRPLFAAGLVYERTVNRYEALKHFRANIFAVLRKPYA